MTTSAGTSGSDSAAAVYGLLQQELARLPPPGAPGSELTPPSAGAADDMPLPTHPMAGPSGDLWTDLGRRAATAGTDALAGFLALPQMTAAGVDWLGRQAGVDIGAVPALAGVRDPTNPAMPAFPDPATARALAYGTTGATEYVPQTTAGRLAQAALTGLASGGLGIGANLLSSGARLLIGEAPELAAVGQAARQMPGLAAGAATGEAAGDVAQAADLPPAAQRAARLIGFAPGTAAANLAIGAGTRLAGAATGAERGGLYPAYQRLGIDPSLTGSLIGNRTMQALQNFAARMPGAGDVIATAAAKAVGDWQDALDRTASSLGSASTPTELGQALQTGAQSWLDSFRQNNDANWGAFRQLVPAGTPIGVANFSQTLNNILGDYQGAENLRGVYQDNLAGRTLDALQKDTADGTLPWGTVQAVRGAIGDKLASPQIIGDASQTTLKRLYGALSDDMRAGAAAQGGSAATLFPLANAYTAAGHGLIEGSLSGLLKPNATPEQAAAFALGQARQGATRIGDIAQALPPGPSGPGAAGEIGSYMLRNAATNLDSPTAFAANLAGRRPIMAPEVQGLLFGDPATAQTVQDLSKTGASLQAAERYASEAPSGMAEGSALGRILPAIEMGKLGYQFGGVPGAAVGLPLGFLTPNLLAGAARRLALNPQLAAVLATPGFRAPALNSLQTYGQRAAIPRQPAPGFSLLSPY